MTRADLCLIDRMLMWPLPLLGYSTHPINQTSPSRLLFHSASFFPTHPPTPTCPIPIPHPHVFPTPSNPPPTYLILTPPS